MNERLGLVEELAANRARYARFAYRAPALTEPVVLKPGQPDPMRALREEISLLRTENMRLRSQLCSKMNISAVGAPTIETVVACFLRLLNTTGYTTDTGQITVADLMGHRKARAYSRPRHVAMWLVRKVCRYASLPMIGHAFGKADHTCVKHACTRIQKRFDKDPFWCDLADRVLATFGERR